jgi:hypothetical protein
MTKYPNFLVCIYNVYYIITRVLMTFLHILICHPGHTDTAISEEVSASRCFKRDHCYSFLKDAIDSEIVDSSAFRNQEKTKYMPYRRVRFLYGEYEFICQQHKLPFFASESTFRRAFRDIEKTYADVGIKIKFNSGKGN